MSTETYVLPASVMNIIQQLSFQLHVITPTTLTQERKKRLPTVNVEDDGWSTVRTTFKSTVIEKKEGIEKTINIEEVQWFLEQPDFNIAPGFKCFIKRAYSTWHD